MSNLIRGKQSYLFNSIGPEDIGTYFKGGVATGAPILS